MGWFKNVLRKWLGIIPTDSKQIQIMESLSHGDNILCNQIWYRGDPEELSQFYKAIGQAGVNKARFWAAVPNDNETIRKLHTGLPALIVDTLNDITNDDCLGISLVEGKHSKEQQELWDIIQKDNRLNETQKDATKDVLVEGDGAFKISIDLDITPYPIIEFYAGERVDYVYNRNRLIEVIFYSYYEHNGKDFTLEEHYGKNYIKYKLLNDQGKEIDLNSIPETANLEAEGFEFTGDFIMAVPLKFFKSSKYKHRGQCLFETKRDAFDALDEVVSSWLDAFRLGRAEKFIPEDLIPRGPSGEKLPISSFTNRYKQIKRPMEENVKIEPTTVQPEIPSDQYLAGYIQFLDMCLMGIISPSTLGIDVKKLDNGEAQREKEKATMYTRNKIIKALTEVMPKVADIAMKTYDLMYNRKPREYEATIEFGEYNNPSFEAVVETIGKARMNQIMSFEMCVEQMYGDTLSDEDKAKEVALLKEQFGTSPMDSFFPPMDDNQLDDEEDENKNNKKKPNEDDI